MGAVRLSADTHGPFLSCLNCGFHKSGDALRKFDAQKEAMVSSSAKQAPSQPRRALANS
jgi:hypothetical protein